jgi:ketosteroid isomerase-like protein
MGVGQPSDWVDGGGGERPWAKILLLGGGGCLVVVIALGALSTWGVCSGVGSCCDRIEEQHAAMVMPVQNLLDAIGAGDTQRAYLSLSDTYREAHSQAEFDAFVEENAPLFDGGTARVIGSRSVSRNGKRRVYLSVLIMGGDKNRKKGNATFLVRQTGKTNQNGDPIPVIDDLFVGEPDELREEREINVAVQLHLRRLGEKDFEGAWALMDPEFTSKMDRGTFEAYVNSQGDLFGPEAHARIRALDSDGATAEAKVDVMDLRKFKSRGTVVYGLRKGQDGQWRIRDIRTEVDDAEELGEVPAAPGDPADAGGAQDGADASEAGEVQDAGEPGATPG